jgi:hypothetical protein
MTTTKSPDSKYAGSLNIRSGRRPKIYRQAGMGSPYRQSRFTARHLEARRPPTLLEFDEPWDR